MCFTAKIIIFSFFHFIVPLNMIDNWVMCITQWSDYVLRIIFDKKALIWFQSQLPSSNHLEMASKWRWHMRMLSFQPFSKECHHHRLLALYSVPFFQKPPRDLPGPARGSPGAPNDNDEARDHLPWAPSDHFESPKSAKSPLCIPKYSLWGSYRPLWDS